MGSRAHLKAWMPVPSDLMNRASMEAVRSSPRYLQDFLLQSSEAKFCTRYERKSSDFRPPKLPPLSILYSGVSWCLSRGVFSSPFLEDCACAAIHRNLGTQPPNFKLPTTGLLDRSSKPWAIAERVL
jgi:hypothetical protein